jgi:hypothetical protein
MFDLLIGCRASHAETPDETGVIVKVDSEDYVWILTSEGHISFAKHKNIRIHLDDVKFLHSYSRNHKARQKIMEGITNRAEILDL